MCLIEVLCEKLDLKPGMRVLDMGCGAGFTSIILANEYAEEIPDGKSIWRTTADYDLHDADVENYLTLMLMTAIKK